MNPKEILSEAKRTGRVWLGGEMEFKNGITAPEACHKMVNIAEQCGYLVTMIGSSIVEVTGGDIPGFIRLDWFDGMRPGPTKVELWTCEAAYVD